VLPYGLSRPYFLVCNQFWIHKSTETVIEAAAIARDLGLDADIVFTGRMEEPRKPGYIDGLHRMIEDLGVGDRIKLLGYIPKPDQIELMKSAVAVVQPTLFEGGPGGGAVYDAVSLGIRAIVSDIPINRELPLREGYLTTFKTRDAADLVKKMQAFLAAPYTPPSPEDLYQLSRRSAENLSRRLYEAIDYALLRQQVAATK
jgi:glycosyltransferase involved in cell wall biosynthesis